MKRKPGRPKLPPSEVRVWITARIPAISCYHLNEIMKLNKCNRTKAIEFALFYGCEAVKELHK